MTRAIALLLAGLLLLIGGTAPLRADEPAAAAPAPAPSASLVEPFTIDEYDWTDATRQRSVPVRLYLPRTASVARPVPLIVFSHGIGGTRRGYTYLGTYWASQGFASLHLQHVGSDRGVWTGNPIAVLGRLQSAAQDGEAMDRVRDLSFAIDQLLAGANGPRIDAQRIVAAGHSYGANTALLAIGARIERDGAPVPLREPRIKAAIVISAPPFYGEAAPRRILGAISVPTLHITATEDIIRVPGYFSPAADRLEVFEATGSADKTLAVFEGGSHNIFSDRGMSGGATLNPQVKAATQALTLAFLQRVFGGEAGALRQWGEHHAALLARFKPPAP